MNKDLHKVRAGEVMHKEVHWTTPQATLRSAARLMSEKRIRALLVSSDDPSDLPGIVTSKDVVNIVASQNPDVLEHLHVSEVMTRPAVCVPKQANLLDCLNLMRMTGVRRVPVLDGMTVVGILSTSDVFKFVMQD